MTPGNVRTARLLAMAADVVQIVVFPLFAGGALSPWDDGLDLLVAAVLTRLLGWHWAFLPTFLAELLPGVDLFPTWSAAMAYITWQRARSVDPTIIDIEPLPPRRLPKP